PPDVGPRGPRRLLAHNRVLSGDHRPRPPALFLREGARAEPGREPRDPTRYSPRLPGRIPRRVLAPAGGVSRAECARRHLELRGPRPRTAPARARTAGGRPRHRALGRAPRRSPPPREPRPRLSPHRRRARIAGPSEPAPSPRAARRVSTVRSPPRRRPP